MDNMKFEYNNISIILNAVCYGDTQTDKINIMVLDISKMIGLEVSEAVKTDANEIYNKLLKVAIDNGFEAVCNYIQDYARDKNLDIHLALI